MVKHRERLFDPPPERVICSLRFKQNWVDDQVEFLPAGTLPTDIDGKCSTLLIVDDVHEKHFEELASWFLGNCRHMRTTIAVSYQALFPNSDHFRIMNQNADFLIMFYTVRNVHQISLLGRQLYGYDKRKVARFVQVYNDCVARPYGYLVIDLTAGASHRLRTFVLPDDGEFEKVFTV